MRPATKTLTALAVLEAVAVSCSSVGDDDSGDPTTAPPATATAAPQTSPPASSTTAATAPSQSRGSVVVPFTAANGSGTITISGGGSPVAEWFANLPGEVSLDLVDADIDDEVSVVEELVSFWFFRGDDSGDVPPSIFVSASGDVTDSVGTSYVVEAQPFPPAPGTATTTTTTADISETAATTATVPVNTESPTTTTAVSEETATTTTTTTASAVPETTTTTTTAPVISLQVQVLNGSGVAGAAGRLTEKLSQAGYAVLSPGNAQRYRSSAVYYAEGWESQAREILETSEIEQIADPTPMPPQFSGNGAAVVVLLGTDTVPAETSGEQTGLRPPRTDITLPLDDGIPRDRYVPGLAYANIYTEQSETDPASAGQLVDLALFFGRVGYCHPYFGGWAEGCSRTFPWKMHIRR